MSLGGGAGATDPRAGGAGGTLRWPPKAGGTPNRCDGSGSSIGCFGGLGGGGGPGAARGGSVRAYFPASDIGGGTANLGRAGGGGESRGGVGSRCTTGSIFPDLRGAGGGGGAAPRLGRDGAVSETERCPGGGGGGALNPPDPFTGAGRGRGASAGGGGGGAWLSACSCFRKSTIKAWLSRMKSSLRPFDARSSPKCSLHSGSKASNVANSERALWPLTLPEREWLAGAVVRGDSGGVGADECRWPPKMPPSSP